MQNTDMHTLAKTLEVQPCQLSRPECTTVHSQMRRLGGDI